jgi:glycosyltransferase involved in cell wall biosynthesis
MRILHVHDRAAFQGGVEQILFDTARGLSTKGWPQALLTVDENDDPAFKAAFELVGRDCPNVAGFQPDAVLMHKVSDHRRVRALAQSFPTAHMVHDHDLVCPRRHKYFPLNQAVCNQPAGVACYSNLCFVQRADKGSTIPIRLRGTGQVRRQLSAGAKVRKYLVGSAYMKRELEMNGIPASRISVLHPVPAALSEPRAQELGAAPDLLFVGQVIRGKGVDLMLRALSHLKGEWTATVVGSGSHLEACRALARELGISEQVTFTGWVEHGQLEQYYARARAVVVPSRWPEPFGMVGVESMARGRAVIAFDTGGISDWLQDRRTGFLVPPADVPAMASAMQRLLADQALAEHLGHAGAKRVKQDFSHQAYLAGIKQHLEKLK